MRKDKQQSSFVNMGSSSLLVIFLVLCLVTFSILSVSSAKSDYSFSERMAEHKKEYYEASARAEQIVGEIDDKLMELAENVVGTNDAPDDIDDGANAGAEDMDDGVNAETSGMPEASAAFVDSAYVASVVKMFDGMRVGDVTLSCDVEDEDVFISYEVPVGEKQVLKVRLLVTDDTKEDTYYKIVAWQVDSSQNWTGDESIELMPIVP